MSEEMTNNKNKISKSEPEFMLFLILILLLMGNRNTFSKYFELFEEQVNKLDTVFEALQVTASGLQNTIQEPQNIMQNL